jgi:predicted HAD superfamily phosphohydrolase YqeG
MSSPSPSSGPLVLQSRPHYLQRSSSQNSRRSDVLKDVHQLTDIDLDVWTALNIHGVLLDLDILNALSLPEQQDWIKAVQSINITVFGLDRSQSPEKSELNKPNVVPGFDFPVIRQGDRLLLTTLKDSTACLSSQPDRVVFLGQHWGDRAVSWILGCRFTAVQPPTAPTVPVYQTAPLSDLQA